MNVREMIEFLQTQDPLDEVVVYRDASDSDYDYRKQYTTHEITEIQRREFGFGDQRLGVVIRHKGDTP